MSSAVPLNFDDEGICTGCQVAGERVEVDWARREKMFQQLCDDYRDEGQTNYDCVIPVSGGKDSYYQIHLLKKYGMNPLLVTYHANNYTDTGMKNLRNMQDVFGCDHIFFTPALETLRKLNRLGMHIMGDMNWHAHCGIETYPIIAAVQNEVPLMIWGEHGFMDLGGMHSYNDFIEFTYRSRHEHSIRGFEWYDIIEQAQQYDEVLTQREMFPWMYPSDEDIDRVGIRGIFISNFFKWEANEHTEFVKKEYGFLEAEEPFERTYRRASNLDDMHENGIHDYLKFVKFGYGRATDHVCKDIRAGKMTRDEGIAIVNAMDPIKSKDLVRWLDYVGWTEQQFDRVCDKFRDPRVWWIRDGQWWKDNLDGTESAYGAVNL